MRQLMLVSILVGGLASGQGLVEHAAAAAGGSVGGVAGKKVSDGLTSVFNKVNHTAKAASHAKTARGTDEPLMEVGPGTPRAPLVPPPPPVKQARTHRSVRRSAPPEPAPEPVIPPPPPPQVTAGDLAGISTGESRADVLSIGAPAARITMFEDGHMVEIYRYMSGDADLGAVHLSDGAVSRVQLQ